MVTLLDEGPVFDAMGKLREVYPNVLHIERPVLQRSADAETGRIDHRKMGDLELFSAFFEQVTGVPLNEQQQETFIGVADGIRSSEREGPK